jgi:hypothetical protein
VNELTGTNASSDPDKLAHTLAGFGHPGFAHLPSINASPAAMILAALIQPDFEVRIVEALPWVVLQNPNLNWAWLVSEITRGGAQNRLGFIVALALELATSRVQYPAALEHLSSVEKALERVRRAEEDTLCRASMPAAERKWLAATRSAVAVRWNLTTGLTPEQLPYADVRAVNSTAVSDT